MTLRFDPGRGTVRSSRLSTMDRAPTATHEEAGEATRLDAMMEAATRALVGMDYAEAERLCVEALAEAKRQGRWAYYTRIVLPLQEARRQRRMIAADTLVGIAPAEDVERIAERLHKVGGGCVVVVPPVTVEAAAGLLEGGPDASARKASPQRRRGGVEVVYAEPGGETWRVRSVALPDLAVDRPAPPEEWIGRWLVPDQTPTVDFRSPADWYLDAAEALGDAAIREVDAGLSTAKPSVIRIEALERMIVAVPTHEKLHQRLAETARTLAGETRGH